MKLRSKLILAATLVVVVLMIISGVAQIRAALATTGDPQMRMDGFLSACVFSSMCTVPLVPVQIARKKRHHVFGRIAAVGILVGCIFGQYAGMVGRELNLFNPPTAVLLVVFGMCLCGGSLAFGLFAPKMYH